jgi:hypothetical protein
MEELLGLVFEMVLGVAEVSLSVLDWRGSSGSGGLDSNYDHTRYKPIARRSWWLPERTIAEPKPYSSAQRGGRFSTNASTPSSTSRVKSSSSR